MKKIINLAVAIAALFTFSSCHKDNLEDNGSTNGVRIVTAEFENKATKTALNSDGMTPEWNVGDVIRILNATTYQDVTLVSGEDTPTNPGDGIIKNGAIVFAIPETMTGTLYAVYPASATTKESCPDGNIDFTIPAVQDGTFASANICVAKSSEDDDTNMDNLIFRNATAVLEITTPSDVVKVEVTATNNIAGAVTASFSGSAVSLLTKNLNEKSVSVKVKETPSGNKFYFAVAPVTTGDAKVTCSTLAKKGSATKESNALQKNVIYSIDLSSPEWKNMTIADILPQNFPSVSEGSQGTPSGAWKSTDNRSCYLSSDRSTLVFYYGTESPQECPICTDADVAVNNDGNYEYTETEGPVKVTFSMAEGEVTSIIFAGNETWNGQYQQSACVAAGTMVTMENGERKAVEELAVGDMIRTFDHNEGKVSSAPVCFVWKTENASNAFTLTFEGGTEVTVIEEHGFYDFEKREYAFINANNAKDYIGHHFYDADKGVWLELKGCKLSDKGVDAYAIVSSKHLNHLSNGMLSMCDGSIKVIANVFEYDDRMMIDADKKAANIAEYGLTPLEKILEYKGFTEADYYDYNLQYLNVAIGKGLTSWDFVKAFSDYCEAYMNQ